MVVGLGLEATSQVSSSQGLDSMLHLALQHTQPLAAASAGLAAASLLNKEPPGESCSMLLCFAHMQVSCRV